MNSGVNGEPWQATRSWRGCRGFAASDGPTCSLYRSRLTRTFKATVDAGLADTGDAVLSQDGSAARAATAAPPRSRLRREIRSSIRSSEGCSLMACYSLRIGLAGLLLTGPSGTRCRRRQVTSKSHLSPGCDLWPTARPEPAMLGKQVTAHASPDCGRRRPAGPGGGGRAAPQ